MYCRPRILRASASIRQMVQETSLLPRHFIAPLFIVEGVNIEEEIPSLTGYYRRSLDKTLKEVADLYESGIRAVMVFIKCPDARKDNAGTEALREDGLMQESVRAIRSQIPDMVVMTDVALDPYSSYGHDGIVVGQDIVNDSTVELLTKMAISHAAAGAHFVAPSDMMDGRVGAIRLGLEQVGFTGTGIMSYSAKYASCFYGPFRDALDSAPGFGDKKTYQMDPANRTEAVKEVELDVKEGADIVMVKPALSYLDIIREIKNTVHVPVSAYQVSGEYAMIRAAARNGWIDADKAILETLMSIKRAGADLIATYFTKDIIRILNQA